MPIQVVCPKCGLKLNAPDTAAGKRIRCKCGEIVGVPQGTASPRPASAANPANALPGKASSVAPTSNMFDVLTDRDLEQKQINPYAPSVKKGTSDAAALKTYLRKDDTEKTKAQSTSTNIVILIIGFLLGVVKNGFLIAVFFLLANILEQAAEFDPLIRAGTLFVGIVAVYAVYNLATAIGLILRKNWGWWLCVIGLAWAIAERIASVVTVLIVSEEKTHAIGGAFGGAIFSLICIALINFMMQRDTQKRFGVTVKPVIAWSVAVGAALVLVGIAFGIGYVAGTQMEQAATALPVDAGGGGTGP